MAHHPTESTERRRSTRLTAAAAPHIALGQTTRGIMGDVFLALLPALAVATYFFGPRVLTLALITAAAAVAFEVLCCAALRKSLTITDLSAAVTGLLLALCLPVTAPYWMAVLGAGFAIVLVKQLYGGIGRNFLNPALAGWAFLTSFPTLLQFFVPPAGPSRWTDWLDTSGAVASLTPMEVLRQGAIPAEFSLRQLLLGQRGGPMGEIAAFALILGGLYLLLRGVIKLRIPISFVGTVAALTFLFPRGNDPLMWMLYQLLGGGLLLGAIFMATDCTTSPVTPRGQVFYGVGCGVLTVFLRYFGTWFDGVGFAILLMNLCVPLFDLAGTPRRYGSPKRRLSLPKISLPKRPKRNREGGADDGA